MLLDGSYNPGIMWRDQVLTLARQVTEWASGLGLQTVSHDPNPGDPILEISGAGVRYYLEPAEFAGQQLPPIVWLYAYPTLSRVRLVAEGGDWEISSSDGVPFHRKLDKSTFEGLLADLNADVA